MGNTNVKNVTLNEKSDTKDSAGFRFCETSRTGSFAEKEGRLVVARGWGQKEWGLTVNGHRGHLRGEGG